MFRCTVCGNQYASGHYLKRHIASHEKDKLVKDGVKKKPEKVSLIG